MITFCHVVSRLSINEGFDKEEQTEAGYRLVREGHFLPPPLLLPLHPPLPHLPSLPSPFPPMHGRQSGLDLPKKKINKPLTEK